MLKFQQMSIRISIFCVFLFFTMFEFLGCDLGCALIGYPSFCMKLVPISPELVVPDRIQLKGNNGFSLDSDKSQILEPPGRKAQWFNKTEYWCISIPNGEYSMIVTWRGKTRQHSFVVNDSRGCNGETKYLILALDN